MRDWFRHLPLHWISALTSSANDRSDRPIQEDLSPPLKTGQAANHLTTILADSGTITLNRDGKLSPEQVRQLGSTISLSRWLLYPLGAALAVVIILFGFLITRLRAHGVSSTDRSSRSTER
jgi:hypothetical protein